MFVNSVYRQFADRRPRIVNHCPDIPWLRQAKTSCLTVNVCAWTAEIAFKIPVCPSQYCFFFRIITCINVFATFLRHWLRLSQRRKCTAVFNAVLLVQIRSTCCDGSARYGDDLLKKHVHTCKHCVLFSVSGGKQETPNTYLRTVRKQSANSPQTRP
jgi:hypothetical protein